MKNLQILVDPGGLHHHAHSGQLVMYLEAPDIRRLALQSDLIEGLQIAVQSNIAEAGEFKGNGTLALDRNLNQWLIEFRDEDVQLLTGPKPTKQVSDIMT